MESKLEIIWRRKEKGRKGKEKSVDEGEMKMALGLVIEGEG